MQYLKSCFLYFLLGNLSDTNILSKSTSQLWKIEILAFRIQYHQMSENFTHLIFIPLTLWWYTLLILENATPSRELIASRSTPSSSFRLFQKLPVSAPFSAHIQPVSIPLAPHHLPYSTSVTYGMPYYATVHQMLLNHLSREADGISKGENYPKHVSTHVFILVATERVVVGRQSLLWDIILALCLP